MAIESAYNRESGPFAGVSCLPWRQRGQVLRSPLALNVDFSRGTIKSREGFKVINPLGTVYKILGVHGFRNRYGERFIAALYFRESNYKTYFQVIRADGTTVLTSAIDMGAFPRGLPPDPYGYPEFHDIHGSGILFTTPGGAVHFYDPQKPTTGPEPLEVGKLWSVWGDSASIPYVAALPKSSLVHAYGPFTVYAGFDYEYVPSSTPIPENQNELDATWLSANRSSYQVTPAHLMWSLEGSPTNIPIRNIDYMGLGKEITALASQGTKLLVFTIDDVMMGTSPVPGQIVFEPLAKGVGCVGARTVVSGRGSVAWMDAGGFHMWDGNSIRHISEDISDMFTPGGWKPTPMYGLSKERTKNFNYPFRISRAQLREVCGAWDHDRQVFWWSVPVTGGDHGSLERTKRICLIYSPAMDSWAIWSGTGNSTFNPTCLTTFFDGTTHKLVFGNDQGQICSFGDATSDKDGTATGEVDPDNADAKVDIEWVWQSPIIEGNPEKMYAIRTLRVRHKAVGSSTANDIDSGTGRVYGDDLDHKWYIDTEKAFDQQDIDSASAGGASDQDLSFDSKFSSSPQRVSASRAKPRALLGSRQHMVKIKMALRGHLEREVFGSAQCGWSRFPSWVWG